MKLSQYANSRDNNYNLIRFVAAVLVLVSHCYPLVHGDNYTEPLGSLTGVTLGMLALNVFFITSGFLVAGSLVRRNNLMAFVWARALRIYPALIVALFFCVFVVGLAFTNLPWSDYVGHKRTLLYFFVNSLMIKSPLHELPGVFTENAYAKAVNGSLWTLPWELRMYFLLAIVGFSAGLRRIRHILIPLLAVAGTVIHQLDRYYGIFQGTRWGAMFQFISYFFIGASLFLYRDKVTVNYRIFYASLAVMVLSAAINRVAFYLCFNTLLPITILCLSYVPGGVIREFNRCGDFSYGIYIYAFPIQQSVAAVWPEASVSLMFLLAFPITLAFSIASWYLIERRFLAMKGGYVWVAAFVKRLTSKRSLQQALVSNQSTPG